MYTDPVHCIRFELLHYLSRLLITSLFYQTNARLSVYIYYFALYSVKLPQWAVAEEVEDRDEDSPTGVSPRAAPGARPMPKTLKPTIKKPASLQRQAALQIVTHADLPSLFRLVT